MLRCMAARRRGSSGPKSRARASGRRWPWVRLVVVVVGLAVVALPAWRAWWRWGETNPLRRGLDALEDEGCVGCHRAPDGAWRWRADDRPPESLTAIEDALRRGRPAAVGLGPRMPAAVVRPGSTAERGIVLAVGATVGLVGIPGEPELAVGYEIAGDAGCFSCHGPLGAGGVPAAGTIAGEVPGWHGRSFTGDGGEASRVRGEAVMDGARQPALPWARSRGARLAMPAYSGVLDSTEIEAVVRYVEWVRHEEIVTPEP